MLTEAEPNAAHVALAELERLGFVEAVVTQNIDLLHERAGSRDVVEVHGSIRSATCPGCGEPLIAGARARAAGRGRCARLPVVRRGAQARRRLLRRAAARRGDRAGLRARARRGLLLVVGSALEVYPVAGLPEETLAAGGTLAIVNRGPTPYDARATLRVDGSAGEVLAAGRRRA